MGQNVGEEFVRALAGKDRAALKAILRSDVDFRAMTPSRFWESVDAGVVIDDILLGQWFAPTDVITDVVDIETSDVGDRHRVGYRFKVTNEDGDFLVEQQGYFDTDGDRVSWLRIMCAGYIAISEQERDTGRRSAMNGDGAEQTNPELRVIETLIDEHVRVDCNLIQIDEQTWAIHGTIAVDGEVIMAEFSNKTDAELALERIAAAGNRT